MIKITATIIAKNEEKNLSRAIASLKDLADEIVVVVDSGTTDRTRQVATKLGAKCYLRDFDDFAGQKNFATKQAHGEWILSLDADEEIPLGLAEEIKKAVQSKVFKAYIIPRRNFLLGRGIKHTRWSPDKHIWLWRKGSGKWVGAIHEEVVVGGEVGELKNAKIHHSYETVSAFLTMINQYTEMEAKRKVANGEHFSFIRMFFDAAKSFIGRYVYKRGYLDGWQGFALSYMKGIYRIVTWAKVWEREK